MKTVKIAGSIVPNEDKWIYEWLGYDATCPKDVENALNDAKGEEVTIQINSGGGDIGAGNEMAYLIRQYSGKTTTDIMGYCCSAATLPACASDKCRMEPSALYMIHNVSSYASGDYNTFTHEAGVLKIATKAISKAYQQKTGKGEEELLSLMNEETWLTAEKAKEEGFVDEIIGDGGKLNLAASFNTLLSRETIEKIRNAIKDQHEDDADFLIQKKTAEAKLQLIEMEGKANEI